MSDYPLYLAQVLTNRQGDLSGVAGLDETAAPWSVTDSAGQFVFADVEPGVYVLVIRHPHSLYLAHDVTLGQDVVLEIREGQITDLGLITVSIGS